MSLRYKYDSVADMPSLDNSVDPVQVVSAHNESSTAHSAAFDAKAEANHTHVIAEIAGVAPTSHTHTASQITDALLVRTASVPDEETALAQSVANPDLVYWWEESD